MIAFIENNPSHVCNSFFRRNIYGTIGKACIWRVDIPEHHVNTA